MAIYTSPSGKIYSDSEVEKVGGTTYVKGTSIAVTPSGGSGDSGSGSGGSNNKSDGGSSSGGGGGSKSNNVSKGGLNAPVATGYAYVDKYGFTHVLSNYDNAKLRSADGNVYDYYGKHWGGYAYDDDGYRVPLDLPGAKPFGNDLKNERGYSSVPKAGSLSNFSGKIGGLATQPARSSLNSDMLQFVGGSRKSEDDEKYKGTNLTGQLRLGGSNTYVSQPQQTASSLGTPTRVVLADGRETTGYIDANGITRMADGSRPPLGAKVQTAAGWYQMTDQGGQRIIDDLVSYAPGSIPGTGLNNEDAILQKLLEYSNQKPEQFTFNNVNSMSYDDAYDLASDLYGSTFKRQRDKAMQALQADLARRGLFGQLDAATLQSSTAAEMLDAENAAIAQLAQQLMEQDYNRNFQNQQLQMQAWTMNQEQRARHIQDMMALYQIYMNQNNSAFEREMARQELLMKQQQLERDDYWRQLQYELDKRQVDYATSKPYYSPNSGASKPTAAEKQASLTQEALAWINQYKDRFRGTYPAKNMYEQVKRNIAAGTMDPSLGYEVLKQLENLYME